MEKKRFFQEVSWADVRQEVLAVNPTLATIIDDLDPSDKLPLIKASYSFGDLIIKDGELHLPIDNKSISIKDSRVPPALKKKLSYSQIPLCVILNKSHELFIDTGTRVIPLSLATPGSLLGLFELFDSLFQLSSKPILSVTAGARTIFMLPKLSERSGIKRLCRYFDLPITHELKNFSDHWHTFKAISAHSSFNDPWQSHVLLFPENWFREKYKDGSWFTFHNYLMKSAWQQAQHVIGKFELSLSWGSAIHALSSRRMKPSPYHTDQIRHLLAIAAGRWPGLRPAGNELNDAAPIKELQRVFIEIYNLKEYWPTIMQVYSPTANSTQPVYYSLNFPTLLEGSTTKKLATTIMLDLKIIKQMLSVLKNSISENERFGLSYFETADFDFFHVEDDLHHEIKSSREIPEKDQAFLQFDDKKPKNNTFCANSQFWRGSIKIVT